MGSKPRTTEQKERRRIRDAERREEIAGSRGAAVEVLPEIPPLHVQRMGKLFRIAYAETRNLAKFNSGEPCDDGGFETQIDAQIALSKLLGEQGPTKDLEAEGVG